ncbi:hypothetical protein LX36DRAFT_573135 [Colletotrichum falcatum]|nr:hypothetical protein LX36DRAFT_573135 [Colletotrichum falcatum]
MSRTLALGELSKQQQQQGQEFFPSPPDPTDELVLGIDPRLLEIVPTAAAPMAHHPPHGVGEYAEGAKNDNGGEVNMAHDPLGSTLALPQPPTPSSPSVGSTMDQALGPNTKGNRVTKKKAGKKASEGPIRAVKANSCDACRRSKVKCVTEEGATSCTACLKKNRHCCVSGVDARTNKTNQDRLDVSSAAINDYLKDAILLCSELLSLDGMEIPRALLSSQGDFGNIRTVMSTLASTPLKAFQFASGPFRPPIFEGPAKLSDVRKHRAPKLKEMALEQGEIIASLLTMIAFGEDPEVSAAKVLVEKVVQQNLPLEYLKLSIRKFCPFPVTHPVHQHMRRGIEKCLGTAPA